jgi:hypothetical protein
MNRRPRHLPPLPGADPQVIRDTKFNAEVRMRGFDDLPPVVREVVTAVADYGVAQTMITRFGVRDYDGASKLLAHLGESRRMRG